MEQKKAAALPVFHAITGTDVTGRFAGKGKQTCWKAFSLLDKSDLRALAKMGTTVKLPPASVSAIEKLICKLYKPDKNATTIPELRWWLFCKKQAEAEEFPPTQSAPHCAIQQTHYLSIVWENDVIPNPIVPNPLVYGWYMHDQKFVPVMNSMTLAPKSIIHLVKCGCRSSKCATKRCTCVAHNLICTDLCRCSDEEECNNWNVDILSNEDSEEE